MKNIEKFEKFKGWCKVSKFAKSLKIGDIFKYDDPGDSRGDVWIAEVVDKYKDVNLTIQMILYYNSFSEKWRIIDHSGYQFPNMDLVSHCAKPITEEDMREIGHLLDIKKYNI
jgi:hypothetical protein